MPLKDKLNNLTGLQRVFLVAFLICWMYFAIWGSLVEANKVSDSDRNYGWYVMLDFQNPECLPYTTKPISELSEPKWTSIGGTCWHIYTHRKLNDDVKVPFTQEAWDRGVTLHYLEIFLMYFGIYTAIVFISFGLILLAYKVGQWIFAGFKKAK